MSFFQPYSIFLSVSSAVDQRGHTLSPLLRTLNVLLISISSSTAGRQMIIPYFCSLLCWLVLALQGPVTHESEEVEYIESHAKALVGDTVSLGCGSTMPDVFIWGFTKPQTETNVAMVYNYGQGPIIQPQSSSLGRLQVPVNNCTLVIEEITKDAGGLYTCQAMYDTDEGDKFYYTRLDVEEDE